jgi:hypothetical protein
MTDPINPVLRRWAIAEAVYGVLLGGVVMLAIPWKSPWLSVGLCVFAAGHFVSGHGLFRSYPWGWRLAVFLGSLGCVLGLLLLTGLICSGLYLWGTFGDFGYGAAVFSALASSVVLQVFGLYPVLKLCSLLKGDVRYGMGGSPNWRRALLGLAVASICLCVVVGWLGAPRIHTPVSDEARAVSTEFVRATLLSEKTPNLDALRSIPLGAGPLFVSIWSRGKVLARASGTGSNLAAALEHATRTLKSHRKLIGRKLSEGTIKVDRIVDTMTLPSERSLVVALSVNPGVHGLRRVSKSASKTFLPDDLVKLEAFGKAPLIPGIKELRLGLDAERILDRLGRRGGRLERIQVESWLSHKGQTLATVRTNTPGPVNDAASWRAAAIAGGEFILRQIRKDGRFHYQYFPLQGRHPSAKKSGYSLPRHAGTIYSLAQLYGETKEDRFKRGAEKGMAWLVKTLPKSCGSPERTCISKRGRAVLGSAALSVVGMLEYQRQTGDDRHAATVKKLVEFILFMQRPDGDFHHLYLLKKKRVEASYRSMFFSEEAALALVMAHAAFEDPRYLQAAERALDYLTGPKYDFFLGWFVYGADHWTCIAADEAWPRLNHHRYLKFCEGYSAFIRRLQFTPGDWDNEDFRGHYSFSGLLVPQAPGAAGFTEAVLSTFTLAHNHGVETTALQTQIVGALGALSRDQIRLDNSYQMPDPMKAVGGVRRSLVEPEVRIDFTQHAVSALLRGAQISVLFEPPHPEPL